MSIFDDIGKVLTGGLGGVIKKVLDAVLPDNMSEEEKEQAKQKAIQTLHEQGMEELKLQLSDVANARAREVSIAQAGKKDVTPTILALSGFGGFIAITIFMVFTDLDKWGQVKVGLITGLLGTLGTIVAMVFGYYFGSSVGSKQKDTKIDSLTK